jgi:chemotaxis protein CheX
MELDRRVSIFYTYVDLRAKIQDFLETVSKPSRVDAPQTLAGSVVHPKLKGERFVVCPAKSNNRMYLPFIESTRDVFSTMLGWKLEPISSLQLPAFHPQHDITGIIQFSKALHGTAVLCLDNDVALTATEILIGNRPQEVNGEVFDLVGELTNMISGGAKQQLGVVGIATGIPTVVPSEKLSIASAPSIPIEFLSFSSPKGALCLQWFVH